MSPIFELIFLVSIANDLNALNVINAKSDANVNASHGYDVANDDGIRVT